MPVREYRTGDFDEQVMLIREKLNGCLIPSPGLPPSYHFDSETEQAVRRFQASELLVISGVVETTTWNALMGCEQVFRFTHNIRLIPQDTPTRCWAACTAMITNSNIQDVVACTPSGLIKSDDALKNYTGKHEFLLNLASSEFANAHGLEFRIFNQTILPSVLFSILMEGPAMIELMNFPQEYFQGLTTSGHMVVIKDIRSDTELSPRGTTLLIYDPWPANIGKIYPVIFEEWNETGMLQKTRRIFWKRGG